MILNGQSIGLRGQWGACVIGPDGKEKEFVSECKAIKSNEPIKNRLLDGFFAGVIGSETFATNATPRVGTGSSAIIDSESALNNQVALASGTWPVAVKTEPQSIFDAGKVKAERLHTFTFTQGQVVANIAELGVNFIGTQTPSDTLIHTRALVVDSGGVPTVIPVTASDTLILTYTLFLEANLADVVSTVAADIGGVPTNIEVTHRWGLTATLINYTRAQVTAPSLAYNGALGAVGTSPSGTTASGTTSVEYNQSGGKNGVASFTISQGNLAGGITAAASTGSGTRWYKLGFSPALPKDGDFNLEIKVRHVLTRL